MATAAAVLSMLDCKRKRVNGIDWPAAKRKRAKGFRRRKRKLLNVKNDGESICWISTMTRNNFNVSPLVNRSSKRRKSKIFNEKKTMVVRDAFTIFHCFYLGKISIF